jgi:flavorubredoxin
MQTRIEEVADRIYRISTFVPQIGPRGFGFNQFLVLADEPLLYHCGMRGLFPAVRDAVASVLPPERLRWIGFSHVEADECGAMNSWLAAAPDATVVHGPVGCDVSVNDLADRAPRKLADGEVLDLGDRRVRLVATPHVPHNWESVVLFEEETGSLLAGDLLASDGEGPAVSDEDPTEQVVAAERLFHAISAPTLTAVALRRLAALEPRTLLSMHGRSYTGDGGRVLRELAAGFDALAGEAARETRPGEGVRQQGAQA